MTNTEDLLTQALHGRAERAAYQPTPVAEVAARARVIRRRQRRNNLVVAVAAVVAVTVPTALLVGQDTTGRTDPAVPSPSVSIPPEAEDTFIAGVEQGPPPAIDYVQRETYVSGDERTMLLLSDVLTATPYRGGYLVVWNYGHVNLKMTFLDENLDEVWTRCGGAIVVSPDRQLTGYVSGTCGADTMTLTVGPTDAALGDERSVPGVLSVLGILDDGRVVYATSSGLLMGDLAGTPESLPFALRVTDLDEANQVVGVYESVRPPITMLAADLTTGDVRWRQSDSGWTLGRFSPGGSWVTSASTKARGVWHYAFLDGATGALAAEIDLPEDVFVEDIAWEDDSHLLMAVSEGHALTILRVSVDGEITRATGVEMGGSNYFAVTP